MAPLKEVFSALYVMAADKMHLLLVANYRKQVSGINVCLLVFVQDSFVNDDNQVSFFSELNKGKLRDFNLIW